MGCNMPRFFKSLCPTSVEYNEVTVTFGVLVYPAPWFVILIEPIGPTVKEVKVNASINLEFVLVTPGFANVL